jgi:hypothetical protein
MKTGKLAAIALIILMSLGIAQAYGAYLLKNNGELWRARAGLGI